MEHPPLHVASYEGRIDRVEQLLDREVPPDLDAFASDPGRAYLAVHGALYGRHADVVALLIERGSPVDLAVCVGLGDEATARRIVREDPGSLRRGCWHLGYSVLHFAADLERADMVPILVDLGLSPDVDDPSGHAPLYYAARNTPAIETMDALVAAGADVNHASRRGATALAAACRHRRSLPSVEWLLDRGADTNLAMADGRTALHKAVSNGVAEMVDLLLAHGADPHRPGPKRETPLDLARRKGRPAIVDALEGAG